MTSSKTYQSHGDQSGVSNSQRKLERLKLPVDLKGQRVLDIGCNEGFFCAISVERGAREVVGIDLTRSALDYAQDRYGHLPIRFLHQSWDHLPPGPFDVVLWASAMHYASDPGAILRQIETRLAPDGVLILECGVRDGSRKEMQLVQRYNESLWFPTMPYLLEELLAAYSVRQMTQGEVTEGDPTPRFVFHCRKTLPTVMLLRGPHKDGKTSLSNLMKGSASQIISLDHFISRIGAGKYHHGAIQTFLQAQLPNPDLRAVYRSIDAAGLTNAYATLVAAAIGSADRLVIIEGFMTDAQAGAMAAILHERAIVWDANRLKPS